VRFAWATLGVLTSVVAGCDAHGVGSARQPEPVAVFAAASTREALEQVARDFQGQTGIAVEVSPGPSSGLARQIEQGASADLFLSADQASADYLTAKQLVSDRRDLLTNRLVVVVPADSEVRVQQLRDLVDPHIRRLALAEPKVPAGEYARQALRKAGVWDTVDARVVGGIDVRATLQFVARGEAEAGLVYRTDALGESRVRVAVDIDPRLHDPIRYPLVLLRREPVKEGARRFYDYLGSQKAAQVFERAGFGVER
jgi:molybdate transport system substrate-binding protein